MLIWEEENSRHEVCVLWMHILLGNENSGTLDESERERVGTEETIGGNKMTAATCVCLFKCANGCKIVCSTVC